MLVSSPSHLRPLTCALLRGGVWIWSPRQTAMGSPPSASSFYRCLRLVFCVQSPARVAMATRGLCKASRQGPPLPAETVNSRGRGWGRLRILPRRGQRRASGGRVQARAPAWYQRQVGEPGRHHILELGHGVPGRFAFPPAPGSLWQTPRLNLAEKDHKLFCRIEKTKGQI